MSLGKGGELTTVYHVPEAENIAGGGGGGGGISPIPACMHAHPLNINQSLQV
jgi:hypothetical protein